MTTQYRPCLRSLADRSTGYDFPCDGAGRVDLDRMSEQARNNYFHARAMVGCELSPPAVEAAAAVD